MHARSPLLSQLVSSRAYRQLEFLAVGAFFVFQPGSGEAAAPALTRIPSTREDVFSSTAVPARAKRALMKFLKFVLDFEGEQQAEIWRPQADVPLAEFLSDKFNLDAELKAYVLTLTLSLDGRISVADGLAVIHRHLTSMNVFGPGFAAVYPKWGGSSEISQVACRACAVGGGIYMLGTGVQGVRELDGGEIEVDLSSGVTVKTRRLVRGAEETVPSGPRISRLVAVVPSRIPSLFEISVEGAPLPAVAAVAFPSGSVPADVAEAHPYPVFAVVHSSDTGECPLNQCEWPPHSFLSLSCMMNTYQLPYPH